MHSIRKEHPTIAFVIGTRPEIIKLSPLIHECLDRGIEFVLIHTGQHYSETLDAVFFDQLELPTPDVRLNVGSGRHGEQTGEMLIKLDGILRTIEPDVVLVQGDTNSVLAGAIATSKLDAELGHVEAGLRSFDRTMPEETNRVVADHVSEYLFAPTDQSRQHLLAEGQPDDRITVTGNTVVDALYRNRELAREKSTARSELGLGHEEFVLMTAHRAENVDDEERFDAILAGVDAVGERLDTEVIYPVHPRARDRIEAFGLELPDRIRSVEPLDYLDFLQLMSTARLILTDSGGVQEEACVLGTPCVTLRENTERPETVRVGANRLGGVDRAGILEAARAMVTQRGTWENPFGDGTASERILETLDQTIPVKP